MGSAAGLSMSFGNLPEGYMVLVLHVNTLAQVTQCHSNVVLDASIVSWKTIFALF